MPYIRLATRRAPLPDEPEVPYVTAVFWVAFGVPDAGMPDHKGVAPGNIGVTKSGTELERLDDAADAYAEARERTYWEWRRLEGDTPGEKERGMPSPPLHDVEPLFRKRKELPPPGRSYLRHTVNLARIHRRLDQTLLLADETLRRHARAGRIKIRAKTSKRMAIPEQIDTAYFQAPIRFCWHTHTLGLGSEPLDFLDGELQAREAEHVRFDPLVSVADLTTYFPDDAKENPPRTHPAESDRQQFVRWVSEQTAATGSPPTRDECFDWARAQRIAQSHIKDWRRNLPHTLRRRVGERK